MVRSSGKGSSHGDADFHGCLVSARVLRHVNVAIGRAADVADVVVLLAKHLHAKAALLHVAGACLRPDAAQLSSNIYRNRSNLSIDIGINDSHQ